MPTTLIQDEHRIRSETGLNQFRHWLINLRPCVSQPDLREILLNRLHWSQLSQLA